MLRYREHREITAKRDGAATCGHGAHVVKAGERIGYARRGSETSIQCAACWLRWASENADADAYEGRM
jgi:hypothetical protein